MLFVTDGIVTPSKGGIERVTLLLAEELLKRGHPYILVSVRPEECVWQERHGPIPCQSIPATDSNFSLRLETLIKERKIDVVVLQGNFKRIVATLDSLPTGVKKIFVFHNKPYHMLGAERKIYGLTPWSELDWKNRMLKILGLLSPNLYARIYIKRFGAKYRNIASKADRAVFLSESFVRRVTTLTPDIQVSKLISINNPNTFDFVEDNYVEDDKENVVLFVGRLSHPQKNLFDFIDAWCIFKNKHPDWKAVIVGDGEHREAIERYAERKKAKEIRFEGNRVNVADYYKKAKIFVLTSTYEGWGMVIPEAMAHGCVPIAFDSYEALSDIIDQEINGLIIKAFDIKALAEAMGRLADNPEERLRMAAAGKDKIKQFSLNKIADNWESILKELCT